MKKIAVRGAGHGNEADGGALDIAAAAVQAVRLT